MYQGSTLSKVSKNSKKLISTPKFNIFYGKVSISPFQISLTVGHVKASSQCVYSPNALLSFCHYHNNKKALPDSTADVCFLIELSLSLFRTTQCDFFAVTLNTVEKAIQKLESNRGVYNMAKKAH